MMPLAAYADRLSVRPGETISFQVANATGQPVTARVVRIISSDANPAGPGLQVEEVDSRITTLGEPGPGPVPRGSCAVVDGLDERLSGASFSLVCRIFPTYLGAGRQAVIARLDRTAQRGFALMIDAEGHLLGCMGTGSGFENVQTGASLTERRWHTVWLCFDADARELRVGCAEHGSKAATTAGITLGATASPSADGPLLMAAADHAARGAHFNGKLERPTLYDRALSDQDLASLGEGETPGDAVACWDFSKEVCGDRIVDVGPEGIHGRLLNTPARGMTGASWSGHEMCFRHAPDEYGAIHFHEDDIDDCHWPTAFAWTVPDGTRSSVRTCPSMWCRPEDGRRPLSPCSLRRSPTRCMPIMRDRNGSWTPSGRPPGASRRRIGAAIQTIPAIIANTGCRPTTTTRMAAGFRSPPGVARC
jgi:N,N-dimethylformamidase